MNAYELAKYIEDDIQIQEGIAEMLREQADRIAELEKDLYMIQRHYDQLETFSPNKIAKYEEVLQAIANDYHELSDHKIEVQVRNHKKWAREALSLSGNNAENVSKTNHNLPKGK